MIDLTSDQEVLAATIDGEAEGETYDGKCAVANVILNRVKLAHLHPHFGDGTVRGACLAHEQFDCWMDGPDKDRIMALDPLNPTDAFATCIHLASMALLGQVRDNTNNATYYFHPSIVAPAWVAGARWCGVFGSQLYWRDVK